MVPADSAVINELGDVMLLIVDLLLGVEHVVTLLAETHSLELILRLSVLVTEHSSCGHT